MGSFQSPYKDSRINTVPTSLGAENSSYQSEPRYPYVPALSC
jgi:hypothetical protein